MHLIKGPYVLVWYFSLHALFYILFFLWTLVFFYEIFHNSVITLLWCHSFFTYPGENCTAYIKLEIKDILFVRFLFFFIFGIFIEKNTIYYDNAVTVHLSPIPFGQPIRVGSVRDTSFTHLRILFQHKK